MLTSARGLRVFYYRPVCDMRRQLDGLSTMVREELGKDPTAGDLFVFRNRRGDICKILFYDQLGACLLMKRLARGTFRIDVPAGEDMSIEVTHDELAALLSTAQLSRNEKQESLQSPPQFC